MDAETWLIAHRGGESRAQLHASLVAGADLLEIDAWVVVQEGAPRVELRHDRIIHPSLPWLTVRHRLPWPHIQRVWLEAVPPAARVLLDIKDTRPEMVAPLAIAMRAQGLADHAAASTPHWDQLHRLAREAPEIERLYTVAPRRRDVDAMWRAYVDRMERDPGAGVSIHRRLATPERLALLREHRLRAVCYTVDDLDLGWQLLKWGASGLTTDQLDLIPRWRGSSPGPPDYASR